MLLCDTTHNCLLLIFLHLVLQWCFKYCLFTYQFFKQVKLQDILNRHFRLAIASKFNFTKVNVNSINFTNVNVTIPILQPISASSHLGAPTRFLSQMFSTAFPVLQKGQSVGEMYPSGDRGDSPSSSAREAGALTMESTPTPTGIEVLQSPESPPALPGQAIVCHGQERCPGEHSKAGNRLPKHPKPCCKHGTWSSCGRLNAEVIW